MGGFAFSKFRHRKNQLMDVLIPESLRFMDVLFPEAYVKKVCEMVKNIWLEKLLKAFGFFV